MNGGWGDPEVSLQIGLGGWAAQHQRVGVDEGQILPLLLGEAGRGSGVTRRGHLFHLECPQSPRATMNIRYRVALSQIEREHLTLRLNGGKHAARKLKRAQILLAADGGISDEAIASGVSVGDSCRRDTWCIPQLDGAHVACMEDGLDLYGEPADPKWPVVCFDESPTQLIGEVAPADSTGSGSA